MKQPTQELVRRLFTYDPEEGIFRARVKRGPHSKDIGEPVGLTSKNKLPSIYIDGHLYKVSRLAWLYVYGAMPPDQVDHINRDVTDNRICNLRLATIAQNQANCGLYRNNKIGIKNIKYQKGRYSVRVSKDKTTFHIGSFSCLGKAVRAAAHARRKFHGEFGEPAKDTYRRYITSQR